VPSQDVSVAANVVSCPRSAASPSPALPPQRRAPCRHAVAFPRRRLIQPPPPPARSPRSTSSSSSSSLSLLTSSSHTRRLCSPHARSATSLPLCPYRPRPPPQHDPITASSWPRTCHRLLPTTSLSERPRCRRVLGPTRTRPVRSRFASASSSRRTATPTHAFAATSASAPASRTVYSTR
jgi:hypothetical protein